MRNLILAISLGAVCTITATPGEAQTITRRIGAVGIEADSVFVGATNIGLVSIVTANRAWSAPTVSSADGARSWVASMDSIARTPVTVTDADIATFDGPPIGEPGRGVLTCTRAVTSRGEQFELRALNDPGHPAVLLVLTRQQFTKLSGIVARASFVTDSLTKANEGFARSTLAAPADVYMDFQVERQARPPAGMAPRYPDMLRSANVEGDVVAQFVVDTTGRVDMSTVKILKSTHDLFTNAVRGALQTARFTPAELGNVRVRQLVEMPFPFRLK